MWVTRDGRDGLLIFMIKTLSSSSDVDIAYVKPSITTNSPTDRANMLSTVVSSTVT